MFKEKNKSDNFPEIKYQEIKGFGDAFIEAESTTLDKLSKENSFI